MTNSEGESCAIDVTGVNLKGFGHAETTMVDEGEVGSVSAVMKGVEEECDFVAGENLGERFVTLDFDFRPNFPAESEVVSVESA